MATTLDANLETIQGYVDTAVDTLTTEMDRQFREVRGDIAQLDTKVDQILAIIQRWDE